jgi:hypothetical protein
LLSDHRILTFIIDHPAVIDLLLGAPSLVTPSLRECKRLLTMIFEPMTVLESSQTPFAGAYPVVLEAIQELTERGNACNEREVFAGVRFLSFPSPPLS